MLTTIAKYRIYARLHKQFKWQVADLVAWQVDDLFYWRVDTGINWPLQDQLKDELNVNSN